MPSHPDQPVFQRSDSQPRQKWYRWQILILDVGRVSTQSVFSRFRRISAVERQRRCPLEPTPILQLTQVIMCRRILTSHLLEKLYSLMYLRPELNLLDITYLPIFAKPRYPPFWLLCLGVYQPAWAQTAPISHSSSRLMSVCLQVKNRLTI